MADRQQQVSQEQAGEQTMSYQEEARETVEQGTAVQGGGEPGHAAYWCYSCNREVSAEPEEEGQQGRVCAECRSGFIEALVTAQTQPDVRRAQRRRRRRGTATAQGTSPAITVRQIVPLSEALEHLYPQQLMQVLQLLGQAAGRSNNAAPPEQAQEEQDSGQRQVTSRNEDSLDSQQSPITIGHQSPLGNAGSSVEQDQSLDQVQNAAVSYSDVEGIALSPPATAVTITRLPHEGQLLLIRDRSPSHEDEDGEDDLGISDTETEEGMRLEFDAWDSAEEEDEEEWEEVDEDEEVAEPAGEDGSVTNEDNDGEQQDVEPLDDHQGEERQPQVRELRLRTRNVEHNLHQYLQELLQNLVGQNIEVRVELPNGPLYVGNPGDYVDARGFEQLLQQMAENDNSRRGAPPASKSAVDCLPSIAIESRHLEDGSAVCAICKDVVALGEPAKQLPCFHLYHQDCILPWLNSRNSCPVCRYELPTDDPDYEEQKQSRTGTVSHTSTHSLNAQPQTSGEGHESRESDNSDGDQAHDSAGTQNSADVVSEATELPRGVGPNDNAEEEQEHFQSTTETFGLQGADIISANASHCRNEGGVSERGEIEFDEHEREEMRGTGRGWLLLAAGPVLSMMGLVLVLCIGNHLIGGRMQQLGRPVHARERFFQEPHIEQIGGVSEVQGWRRWWMPFQR